MNSRFLILIISVLDQCSIYHITDSVLSFFLLLLIDLGHTFIPRRT